MLNSKFLKLLLILVLSTSSIFSQKINQLDANGKRTGTWIKKYSNENIRYTGQFVSGREVGVFKFYRNKKGNKQPYAIKEYRSGLATVKYFTSDAKMNATGSMIGKKRIGEWKFYFPNGKILSTENYKEGKLSGVSKNYYPNGKVTSEISYLNGLKHGASKKYSNDGVLIEELNFSYNKHEGPAVIYDLKGNVSAKGTYVNDKQTNDWIYYSADGQVVDKKDLKKKVTKKKISKLYRVGQ